MPAGLQTLVGARPEVVQEELQLVVLGSLQEQGLPLVAAAVRGMQLGLPGWEELAVRNLQLWADHWVVLQGLRAVAAVGILTYLLLLLCWA